MKILVVDDGQLAINSLIRILCRVAPDCDYISAMTTDDALTWMRQGPMDAAFLNLEMPGMNGLALARMIQKLQPRCNIIVVTEHPEYALEALQIFVSGFLLKPANEADVRNVLENLRLASQYDKFQERHSTKLHTSSDDLPVQSVKQEHHNAVLVLASLD
mgnify:CR=1 FL=1